ncbi:MAG: hypothetical protein ACLFUO_03475, partial [Candidatus Woesearchaeota archaeon]
FSGTCEEDVSDESCYAAERDFQNVAITSQDGFFSIAFNATPEIDELDSVIGLSSFEGTHWSEYAVLVRFSPDGLIDVRDGDSYSYETEVQYSGFSSYYFMINVNVTSGNYDVYVTPESGAEIMIAKDYSFRTEQANTIEINFMGFQAYDPVNICNVEILDDVISEHIHEADLNSDMDIDISELNNYIELWKSSSSISLAQIISAIEIWKNN